MQVKSITVALVKRIDVKVDKSCQNGLLEEKSVRSKRRIVSVSLGKEEASQVECFRS